MGVLAEYLKNESGALKTAKEVKAKSLSEWKRSLDELFALIERWLDQCDPEGLIERDRERVEGREITFGEYTLPALKLALVESVVRIEPVARHMAALVLPPGGEKPVWCDGAVQVRGNGARSAFLFRLGTEWFIQKGWENLRTAGNEVVPLTAERLEAVIREAL